MDLLAGGRLWIRNHLTRAAEVDVKSIYCYRSMMTTSTGIWVGDNPFHFALPILLYQIIIIFVFSHLIHLLLARLGQPLIVSQLVAGVLLSPTCLGRSLRFEEVLFSRQSFEQLGTLCIFALMLFYFVMGVKADLGMIPRVGKKAVAIAVLSTILPYVFVHLMASAMKSKMPPSLANTPFLGLLANRWSLTSYTVIFCILSELNLLTSKVGRLGLSAALIADIVHMFADACIGGFMMSRKGTGALDGLMGPLAFFLMVGIIMFMMRPLAIWLVQRTPEKAFLGEASFVWMMLMAFACGLMSIAIGFDFLAGPFFFGMVLPGGAPLGTTLVERVDRFVTGVLLPMCLSLAGMRTDLTSLVDVRQWGFMELFVVVSVASKFVGVIVPCFWCGMPHREAFSLGLIMISKGVHELEHAIQWKENQVADDHLYTALIISVIVICGGTTAMVKYLYRPEDRFLAYKRRTMQHAKPHDELGILACVYEQDNVNPILALLGAVGPSTESPVCVYCLHLTHLVGLAHAVLIPYKQPGKSLPSAGLSESDHIANAFKLFEKQYPGAVSVLPYVCISPYTTMYEDACSLALDKNVSLVIIPFHKHVSDDGSIGSASSAVHAVNLNILQYAPCSLGILIDNGLSKGGSPLHSVAVYFFGGPDDREALSLGSRMAANGIVELTVIRFLLPKERRVVGREELIDERIVKQFRQEKMNEKRVEFREKVVRNSEETVGVIRETIDQFNLLIVGRRAGEESSPLTVGLSMWSEYPELGVIGDLLVSADFGGRVSTLVVQQQLRVLGGWQVEKPDSVDSARSTKQVIPLYDECSATY